MSSLCATASLQAGCLRFEPGTAHLSQRQERTSPARRRSFFDRKLLDETGLPGYGTLRDATDTQIWEYAKSNGYVTVSKDSDFQARSLLYGHPPKFIWLRVGNCTTVVAEQLLRNNASRIQHFITQSTDIILELL